MNILLGSANPSKKRSLETALTTLGITDFSIHCFDVDSNVNSKPIGFEIIRGADNRNQECKKRAEQNNIAYDYLCGLEGGYSIDENGLPFIVAYAVIETSDGRKSTGKSTGLRLTRDMFDYVRDGGSLNKLVEELTGAEQNKTDEGFTGFLTNGLYRRDKFDADAIVSAFVPFFFEEQRNQLNDMVQQAKKETRD